ncbi:MAG: hypothetical protein ISQ22_08865 [Rhizobiales bacterium]|nr:hypothetical protein [Hyphomicrobiales bacterium]
MATTIKIKRSTGSTAPSSLSAGELAYTGGSGTYSNGGSRLYVGNPSDASNLVIGGKYFTDALDHAPGTLTASSAIIVDANSKIDNLLVDNLQLNGNTITATGAMNLTASGNIVLSHNGTLDLSTQSNSITMLDNNAAAIDFNEGGTSYLKLVTTNSSEKVVIGKDTTFANDVSLLSDAAVLNFGADSEVNLTHVADTGLLLNSDNVLQFRDSAITIGSSADGQLDIVADTELQITAPTVELNSDAQILAFGVDGDVTLTHVADTGLLLNSGSVIQFRDSALNIGSSVNGQLDIAADVELEITTPTVALNTDGQVLTFGADDDVTLTHVADTALRINDGMAFEFRDGDLSINSSTDGQLDIDADAELEITAPVVDINASTSVNISNDLKLDSDSSVLSFGADDDVSLTHIADTALRFNSSIGLQFRDGDLSVSSPSDGVLAIAADTEVDITASNIDINGNADISGSLNVGSTTMSTAKVSDLTNNRVVIVGTSGELEDDANFTFDGTNLAVTGGIDVTGDLDVDNVNVNGNTVSTTNSNGDLLLSPNGTGTVKVPAGYKDRAGFTSDSLVSKEYVDAVKQSLDIKDSVRVASTANIDIANDLENGDTLDGVTLATGDRVLLKNQSTASENGIYVVVASGAASRSEDANASADVTSGMFVWVEEGTANADQGYVLTTNDTINLNTTSLTFTQFSGAGQITAGIGMTKSGNTLNVALDNITIEDNSDSLRIKGITTTALGDLLIGKASDTGYKRLAVSSGGAYQLLRINAAGTDLEYTDTLDGGTF